MNFELSNEQQMIVDTVRAFVENELYPHEEEVERTGVVPKELEGKELKDLINGILPAPDKTATAEDDPAPLSDFSGE